MLSNTLGQQNDTCHSCGTTTLCDINSDGSITRPFRVPSCEIPVATILQDTFRFLSPSHHPVMSMNIHQPSTVSTHRLWHLFAIPTALVMKIGSDFTDSLRHAQSVLISRNSSASNPELHYSVPPVLLTSESRGFKFSR